MGMMKALLITGIGQLALAEIPRPQPGPHEALVRMEACGICNSTDHKLALNEFFPGPFPAALGHESVGRVVELGEKVRCFRPGDRVLRPVLFDRHVPGGRSTWGGFSEYAVVVDAQAMRDDGSDETAHWSAAKQQVVPAEIAPAQAAAMITLKEALSCLHNLGVGPGCAVAVVGTGPVGQAFAHLAHLEGALPVAVFGRRETWRERFTQLGADDYAAGDAWPEAARSRVAEGGYDFVVEAVGSPEALALALNLAGKRGRVGIYGVTPASSPYDAAVLADPRVTTPRVEEAETHAEMLRWVHDGRIRLDQWFSHALPWTSFRQGFDVVERNHASKVILTMET